MDTSSKKLIVQTILIDQYLEEALSAIKPINYGGKRWFVVSAERGAGTQVFYYGIECPDEFLADWA